MAAIGLSPPFPKCGSGTFATTSTTRYLRPDGRGREYAQRARPDRGRSGGPTRRYDNGSCTAKSSHVKVSVEAVVGGAGANFASPLISL